MKPLLHDTEGFSAILMEHHDKPSAAMKAILEIIGQVVWSNCPVHLLHFGRCLYGMWQSQDTPSWATFCSGLGGKFIDVAKMWPNEAGLAAFMQLRTKYIVCMLEIIQGNCTAKLAENEGNDLGLQLSIIIKYVKPVISFITLCFVEIGSLDCQADVLEQWMELWCHVCEDAQHVMS